LSIFIESIATAVVMTGLSILHHKLTAPKPVAAPKRAKANRKAASKRKK
jgi:hypothetical protein